MSKALVSVGVCLLALGGLVGWRIVDKNKSDSELKKASAAGGARTPVVETVKAGPATIQSILDTVGTLESPYRLQLSPVTAGQIRFLEVREGDEVKPGQVLLKIDPSDADAQVAQAQASVAEARSRLAQAQLGQDPNRVSVSSQIEQQKAAVSSANATEEQVKQNYASQVGVAQSALTDSQAKLTAAQANVRTATAGVERENANLTNLKSKLKRQENLYNAGYVSLQDVENARTDVEVQAKNVNMANEQLAGARDAVLSAKAQVEAAKQNLAIAQRKGKADITAATANTISSKAALKSANSNQAQTSAYKQNLAALQATVQAAQAQLDQAKVKRSNTTLVSTINGTVTARNADPGALATPGQAVLVVQYLDWLYVTAALSIDASSKVFVGQTTNVTFDALPGRTFQGTVSNINPAADIQSRQFGIRIKLNNPKRELRPGMFGHVQIITTSVNAKVVVPKESLKTTPAGSTITVINDKLEAETRQVTIGATDGKVVEVLNGIRPGEQVVTLAYQQVKDGQKVKLPGAQKDKGGSK